MANETAAVEKERFQTPTSSSRSTLSSWQARRGDAALTQEDIKLIDEQINKVGSLPQPTPGDAATDQAARVAGASRQRLTDTLVALGEVSLAPSPASIALETPSRARGTCSATSSRTSLSASARRSCRSSCSTPSRRRLGKTPSWGRPPAFLSAAPRTGGIVGQQAKNREPEPRPVCRGPAVSYRRRRRPRPERSADRRQARRGSPDRDRSAPPQQRRHVRPEHQDHQRHRLGERGAGGLNSPAGTRSILNVVRANKAAFKSALA